MHSLDRVMAYHAAPVLMGKKCANLVCVSADDAAGYTDRFNRDFSPYGLRIHILGCGCGKRKGLFLYSADMLAHHIKGTREQAFLRKLGYDDLGLIGALERLSERTEGVSFPHEIGVFLGYPIDDVIGFVEGREPKICGCWKVYSDTAYALSLFECYKLCRKQLCGRLDEGLSLFEAVCMN